MPHFNSENCDEAYLYAQKRQMKTHDYAFEKLEAWQQAKRLVVHIYRNTSGFPDTDKYGLLTQIRRSAVAICSNIAEGSGRRTTDDRARFYSIAYSSLLELLNQIIIAHDLNLLAKETYELLRFHIQRTSFLLQRLYQSQTKPNR